jgi:hypothetical protein
MWVDFAPLALLACEWQLYTRAAPRSRELEGDGNLERLSVVMPRALNGAVPPIGSTKHACATDKIVYYVIVRCNREMTGKIMRLIQRSSHSVFDHESQRADPSPPTMCRRASPRR